jgi:hypothetical protein
MERECSQPRHCPAPSLADTATNILEHAEAQSERMSRIRCTAVCEGSEHTETVG